MSDKRKKLARAVMVETGMTYQAALNAMANNSLHPDVIARARLRMDGPRHVVKITSVEDVPRHE